jgi:hypothetical protein
MSKIFLILVLFLAACNNSNNTSTEKTTTGDTTVSASSAKWSEQDENDFLRDCVDNAKTKLGEEKSYTYCNCVLKQIRQKFPNLDSASAYLDDSTKAAEFTVNCK